MTITTAPTAAEVLAAHASTGFAGDFTVSPSQLVVPQPRRIFWQGLSTAENELAGVTSAELIKSAGLDWTVSIKPTYRYIKNEAGHTTQVKANDLAVERDDDQSQVGTVRKNYQPFQNNAVFQIGDHLTLEGKGTWIAAGDQSHGSRVFMVMRLNDKLDVFGENEHELFLVFRSSHDGSTALRVDVTPINMSCFNQNQLILRTSKAHWSVRHTQNVKLQEQEAAKTLALALKYKDDYAQAAHQLASITVTAEAGRELIAKVVDPRRAKRDEVIADAASNWLSSTTIPDGMRETGWGLLNGITEYFGHVIRRDNANSVFEAEMNGEGAATRNRAYQALLKLAA